MLQIKRSRSYQISGRDKKYVCCIVNTNIVHMYSIIAIASFFFSFVRHRYMLIYGYKATICCGRAQKTFDKTPPLCHMCYLCSIQLKILQMSRSEMTSAMIASEAAAATFIPYLGQQKFSGLNRHLRLMLKITSF
jgi:hypothetical protein